MSCARVHDFIRGTKITLPRPAAEGFSQSFKAEIVRPNKVAEQIVFRHLKALEAFKAPEKSKITRH